MLRKFRNFVKPGVITGDDVQKVFAIAKENGLPCLPELVGGTDSVPRRAGSCRKAKPWSSFSSPTVVPCSPPARVCWKGQHCHHRCHLLVPSTHRRCPKLTVFRDPAHRPRRQEAAAVGSTVCWKRARSTSAETGKPLSSSHMLDVRRVSGREHRHLLRVPDPHGQEMNMTLSWNWLHRWRRSDCVDNSHMGINPPLYTPAGRRGWFTPHERLSKIQPAHHRFFALLSGNVHGVYKAG